MNSDQLRQTYLDFFREREHLVMPSSSLIPSGDPTLLLTTAGMVQMKPYFLGEVSPPARRMVSAQKVFRTTDIEAVGDHNHLTFFEMLGNFSVGDYFKPEAVEWAWELVTEKLGLGPDRIWITVYTDDDEAYDLWREKSTVPPERIYRYGKGDNWWGPPGAEGPCGPCSEIHYDFGPERGCSAVASPETIATWEAGGRAEEQSGCHPNCERCERFTEIWNLVFTTFYQDAQGNLTDLPAPNVDTGMGYERVAVILQGARTVYDTDLFQPIIQTVCELSHKSYGEDPEVDRAIRVVADHARGACFLIADGVVPGKEGRGYVLRRLIRRAVRFGRELGVTDPFLSRVAETVIGRMGEAYPELAENREFILRALALEEERFGETYERGMKILEGMERFRTGQGKRIFNGLDRGKRSVEEALKAALTIEPLGDEAIATGSELASNALLVLLTALKESQESGNDDIVGVNVEQVRKCLESISSAEAFTLYDTYGFPQELTEEIAAEHGLTVDMKGFQREMEAQRDRGRASTRTGGPANAKIFAYRDLGIENSRFVGYELLEQQSAVVALLVDGESVPRADAGHDVEVVLRETPFYAEGGGQVGDVGEIFSSEGRVVVADTRSPIAGLIVHKGRVAGGAVSVGDSVTAQVDPERRAGTARNHTGTHLAHAALRRVLGGHVRQAGSLVAPDRLRFDFSHIEAPSPEELRAVERLVNQQVLFDLPVQTRETGYAQAVEEGALAFFGDKYGESVRVVRMASDGDAFSHEVCGGTHLGHTSEVGLFLITSESSIGSGLRRIEAITGQAAQEAARADRGSLDALAKTLETTPPQLHDRVQALLEELDRERKRATTLERQVARQDAQGLLEQVQEVNGVKVLAARIDASSTEAMRDVGDYLRDKLRTGVVVLGALLNERPSLMAMVTPDLVERGLDAVAIVRDAAKTIDGGGGGRPELAQAGGKRADLLDEALRRVPSLVRL